MQQIKKNELSLVLTIGCPGALWDSVNLCPISLLTSLLLKSLNEYAYILSLKLPQFCCSWRHCFGKDL